MLARYKGLLLAIAGGTLAAFSLVFVALWPLAIAGLACYFACALRVSRSYREASVHGLVFGLLASLGGVWWFWDTLPLDWLSVPAGTPETYLVAALLFLTALSLALPFALAAPALRAVPEAWYRPLIIAMLYASLEWLRMWSFSLFFLAPETSLAPDFSIAALGYTLTESVLLLPLAQGSVAGLSAGLALAALCVSERTRTARLVALGALIALTVAAHLALPSPSRQAHEPLRVALLSLNVPPGPYRDPEPTLTLIEEAAVSGAKIIAVPEGLGLAPFLPKETRQEFHRAVLGGRDALVISSSVITSKEERRAELVFETPEAGVIAVQGKEFFVPVGEYFPPLTRPLVFLAGKESVEGYTQHVGTRAVSGDGFSSVTHEGVRIGALLCSELLSPRLYAALAKEEKTDLLFNLANNSWFHGSRLLHERLQQVAKTHALALRQPILVAANNSPSYAIDPRGQVLAESAWGVPEALIVDISF